MKVHILYYYLQHETQRYQFHISHWCVITCLTPWKKSSGYSDVATKYNYLDLMLKCLFGSIYSVCRCPFPVRLFFAFYHVGTSLPVYIKSKAYQRQSQNCNMATLKIISEWQQFFYDMYGMTLLLYWSQWCGHMYYPGFIKTTVSQEKSFAITASRIKHRKVDFKGLSLS